MELFVAALQTLDGSFKLVAGHTVLDATSLMGIYCLNLSEPILLEMEEDSPKAMERLRPFIVA